MSPKFHNKELQGTRAEESFTHCVRILRATPNQTCVKLYRSSRLSMESTAENDAFAGVGFPGLFASKNTAMRMPESAVGRSRMQLRAFNEVSRLAADPTQRGARVSFSFGIHYPFDLSPSWPPSFTNLAICPPRGTGAYFRRGTNIVQSCKGWWNHPDGEK